MFPEPQATCKQLNPSFPKISRSTSESIMVPIWFEFLFSSCCWSCSVQTAFCIVLRKSGTLHPSLIIAKSASITAISWETFWLFCCPIPSFWRYLGIARCFQAYWVSGYRYLHRLLKFLCRCCPGLSPFSNREQCSLSRSGFFQSNCRHVIPRSHPT